MNMKKTVLASSIALALGASGAQAELRTDVYGSATFSTLSANFTMLNPGGGMVGGTNNVAMDWDGNAFTASSDYTGPGSVANVTAASTTPFFGTTASYRWTAHDIQVFLPGTYSFNTALGGGNGESGTLTVTVPNDRLGMHMLFDWNGNLNIDVFVVVQGGMYGSGVVRSTQTALDASSSPYNRCDAGEVLNCLWDGATIVTGSKPTTNKIWTLATIDGNADTLMGIPMAAGGPFAGFNA